MRIVGKLLLIAMAAGPVTGHGSTYPPPEPEPERPPQPDPPPPPPEWTGDEPLPITPPPDASPPAPGPDAPGQPGGKGPTTKPPRRPAVRTARGAAAGELSWHIWWELNREHLVGLRGLLRRQVTFTGKKSNEIRPDPLAANRADVLANLRRIARRDPHRTLRAAALVALGRMGGDDEARLCIALLKDSRQPRDVHEGAAVALGILPRFEQEETRRNVRAYLAYVLKYKGALPPRARGLATLAAGLRARNDPTLRMQLIGHATGSLSNGEDAADVAYACGLSGEQMFVPELLRGARKGVLAGKRLSDRERTLAVQALALIGDPNVIESIAKVLHSRRAGVNTRRGATLALGRLLRETELTAAQSNRAGRALKQAFEKENDSLLRGFAAVGLGGARQPRALRLLQDAVDRGGNTDVKPYCALALGLAARTLGTDGGAKIRGFLLEELNKTRQTDTAAALSIALGLARSHEATDVLLERVASKSLPAPLRGAAAQGLGLMGNAGAETTALLTEVVKAESSGRLLEDTVLALGLLGRRNVARELAALIPKTSSTQAQGRIMLALSHLNHSAAVEPLLKVLNDTSKPTLGREFAAVALGLMGDRREEDVLFAVDAYFNFQAGTRATRELVRLY